MGDHVSDSQRCFIIALAQPTLREKRNKYVWLSHPNLSKVTETELLVTVLVHAEMALKRKNKILETIQTLDTVGIFDKTHPVSDATKLSIQKHVDWLLEALEDANESYQTAKEYIERLTELPREGNSISFPSPSEKSSTDATSFGRDSLADAHAARLVLNAKCAIDKAIADLVAEGSVNEMESLLRSVGQLLLVSSVHAGKHTDAAPLPPSFVGRAMQTAAAVAMEPLKHMFRTPPDIPEVGCFETHLYQNALKDRDEALASLLEAAKLLNIEWMARENMAKDGKRDVNR